MDPWEMAFRWIGWKKERKPSSSAAASVFRPCWNCRRATQQERSRSSWATGDELFLNEELAKYGTVYLATEDGSAGTKGNVLDAICANGLKCRCDLCLRPHPDASGAESLCRGKRHRVLAFSGGADGLRRRSLSWPASASPKRWTVIPTSTTSGYVKTDRYSLQTEVEL